MSIAKGGPDNLIVIGIQNYGLSIFDGKIFKNFTSEDGLQDKRVTCADIDSEGNIWVATDGGGVFKYNGESMEHFDVEDGLASSEAFAIYIDDYDKVWVGTFGGGVAFYDGEIKNFVPDNVIEMFKKKMEGKKEWIF